jgi:hypothetical protein
MGGFLLGQAGFTIAFRIVRFELAREATGLANRSTTWRRRTLAVAITVAASGVLAFLVTPLGRDATTSPTRGALTSLPLGEMARTALSEHREPKGRPSLPRRSPPKLLRRRGEGQRGSFSTTTDNGRETSLKRNPAQNESRIIKYGVPRTRPIACRNMRFELVGEATGFTNRDPSAEVVHG